MKTIDAFGQLLSLRSPVITTRDAAAIWKTTSSRASLTLKMLERAMLLYKMKESVWALRENADPLAVAKYIVSPHLSYVSMQSALFQHGMISQIPETIFLATLAPAQKIKTPLGVYSFHHLHPDFFFGFEETGPRGVLLASPEKALLDFFYFSASRSPWFKSLPELELPKNFSMAKCRKMITKISARRIQTIVATQLEALAPDPFTRSAKSDLD